MKTAFTCFQSPLLRSLLIISALLPFGIAYEVHFLSDYCQDDGPKRVIQLGDHFASVKSEEESGVEPAVAKSGPASIVLRASASDAYASNLTCAVSVQTPPGYGLIVSVQRIDLRGYSDYEDQLELNVSGRLVKWWTATRGMDAHDRLGYSSRRLHEPTSAQVKLVSRARLPATEAAGFELVFTTFVVPVLSDRCPRGYFKCAAYQCIAAEVRCNGLNNCGTGADEKSCTWNLNWENGGLWFILKCAAMVLLAAFALWVLVCLFDAVKLLFCTKSHRQKNLRHYTSLQHPILGANLTRNYGCQPHKTYPTVIL